MEDAKFATDLAAASKDPHYAHIIDPTERVHIYRLHQSSALFRQCDKRYIGALECSVTEISAIESQRALGPAKPAPAASRPSKPLAVVAAPAGIATKSPPSTPKVPAPNSSEIVPFLRHDLPDISLFNSIKPPKDATGAQISYSSDRIAKNDSWSIYGVTGFAYKLYGNYSPDANPYILAAYVAPYVSVDRLWNSSSAQAAKNSDTISPGLKFEVGVDNLWGGQQYFRLGGADVSDQIAKTNAASATFEWIPVYDRLIHFPGTIGGVIVYRFDPELIVQFDSMTGGKTPLLFSGRSQALRVGPQLSLHLKSLAKDIPIISSLSSNTTYHWAQETYSGHSLSWFQSALTYNIDPNGYLGFTGSYKKGSDENTGKQVNIYLVSLSAKY